MRPRRQQAVILNSSSPYELSSDSVVSVYNKQYYSKTVDLSPILLYYNIRAMLCYAIYAVDPRRLNNNRRVILKPGRGLLNREKRTKREYLAAYPPPPPRLREILYLYTVCILYSTLLYSTLLYSTLL